MIASANKTTTSQVTNIATITDWTSSTTYTVGQYVQRGAVLFKCTVGHTSTTSFDPSKWQKISDASFTVAMALAMG